MRTNLFDYNLPPELIAARPPQARDGGRMCVVERQGVRHGQVSDFPEELRAGDLLVLNETRVRQARLLCRRPSLPGGGGGARVELLFLHPRAHDTWSALGKGNRPLRIGDKLESRSLYLTVVGRDSDGTLEVRVDGDLEAELLADGTMPIPPYMERSGDELDVSRYQTVFAQELGSAAAPTAGLHITEEMISRILAKGVHIARLVLHVGVGTFRPVSVDELDEHPMHSEDVVVSEDLVEAVASARVRGGRVVAIGSTALRALESARDSARPGRVRTFTGPTDLLIQPGYEFSVVDALWTNFHQPRSTLMALVSAFAGLKRIQRVYEQAVEQKYRFLSYGDAMWIPNKLQDED